MHRNIIILLLLIVPSSQHVIAEDVNIIGWRGDGSGRFTQTEPLVNWSKDSENILWKLKLDHGYSSPVLCNSEKANNGRLLLTARPSDLICIDAVRGEILRQDTISYAEALGEKTANRILENHDKYTEGVRHIKQKYNDLKKNDPNSPEWEELKQERKAAEQKRREYERQYPPEKRGGAGNAAATILGDGSHVPLIIKWPGNHTAPPQVKAGAVNCEVISLLDLIATTLWIAGFPRPLGMQSRIFLGEAVDPPRKYAFSARDRIDETVVRMWSVRDERYHYIHNLYFRSRFSYSQSLQRKILSW